MNKPFLEKPTPWVWFIFLTSLGIFFLSMLTWREGMRFVSRPFRPEEVALVSSALSLWESPENTKLRAMLAGGRLRAMDQPSFRRPQERCAFGYTDERGRILLNPHLCFAYQRALCASSPIRPGDLVATAATLYHESCHLFAGGSESCAYEQEWVFVRALAARHPELAGELRDWDTEMPERVALYVGPEALQAIQLRLGSSCAP